MISFPYDAFEAQHVTIRGRRVRLKKYHIPAIRSEQHLMNFDDQDR